MVLAITAVRVAGTTFTAPTVRPIDSMSAADPVDYQTTVLAPPTGGTHFRFFSIPPKPLLARLGFRMSVPQRDGLYAWVKKTFADFQAAHEYTGTRHCAMHKTETCDYTSSSCRATSH